MKLRHLLLFLLACIVIRQSLDCQVRNIDAGDQRSATVQRTFGPHGAPHFFPSRVHSVDRNTLSRPAGSRANSEALLHKAGTTSDLFEPVSGPYGGTVRSIVRDQEGWLYAATDGEVYRSSDNGAHWDMRLFPSQLHNYVEPVTVLGPGVLAAETDFSNFISTDRGGSWQFIYADVQGFAVDTTGVIYAGSNHSGVMRSTDTAKSWVSIALSGRKIFTVVLCGGGTFACQSDSGMYVSTDTGRTWTFTPYETPYTWNIMSDKRGRLFELRYYGATFDLYRSTDLGGSWQRLAVPAPGDIIRASVEPDGRIIACVDNNILSSSDGGDTWTGDPFPVGEALSVGRDTHGELLVGSFHGIFRQNALTGAWEELNNGIHARRIERIHFTAAGSILVQSLWHWFRSTDGGSTWSAISFDATIGGLSAYAPITETRTGAIFIAAGFDGQCGLLRSTDDGVTWTKVPVLANPMFFYGLAAGSARELYAVDAAGAVFYSTDNGGAWSKVKTGHSFSPDLTAGIAADGPGNCYLAMDSSIAVVRNGSVQKAVRVPFAGWGWQSMSIEVHGELFFGSSGDGVFASSDGGNVWRSTNDGLFDTYVMSMASDERGNVLVGTGARIYRLADSSDSWSMFGDGLPQTFITSLGAAPDGRLFAGTQDFGMYKGREPLGNRVPPVDESGTGSTVVQFQLYQNYPNPFNPGTVIRYKLLVRTRVSLSIFNELGQRVAQLVDREQDARTYEVPFDGRGLASGVYLCRLQTGGAVQVRKLVLVK